MSDSGLLLHVCCAPCSLAIIEELKAGHDLTVLFFNPNIYPQAEYLKRKAEVARVCRDWGIELVDLDYDNRGWEERVGRIPQDSERGARCSACYRQRLARAAGYAKAHGFPAFASSLASGRQKNSRIINAIGRAVAVEVGLTFLDEDWKKKGRYERGLALTAAKGVYRQRYCGCRWSLERAVREGHVIQSAHERVQA